MAYSTNALVASEFKSITFSTDTKIKSSEVDQWITEADEYIDARIGLVYSTPVTATKSLEVLKTISIGLVAQRVSRAMEIKSITPTGDQYIPKDLILEAKERLQMIVDRKLLLSDATEITTHGGVSSYSNDNTVTRKFDQTKDQW